ncbi:hypothetical protein WM94_04470 [Pseudomonas sp. ABFPK]|nr:hypothetical protein WM94_04470 [Pseudomonas sp. ABFPK]
MVAGLQAFSWRVSIMKGIKAFAVPFIYAATAVVVVVALLAGEPEARFASSQEFATCVESQVPCSAIW